MKGLSLGALVQPRTRQPHTPNETRRLTQPPAGSRADAGGVVRIRDGLSPCAQRELDDGDDGDLRLCKWLADALMLADALVSFGGVEKKDVRTCLPCLPLPAVVVRVGPRPPREKSTQLRDKVPDRTTNAANTATAPRRSRLTRKRGPTRRAREKLQPRYPACAISAPSPSSSSSLSSPPCRTGRTWRCSALDASRRTHHLLLHRQSISPCFAPTGAPTDNLSQRRHQRLLAPASDCRERRSRRLPRPRGRP